MKTFLIEEERKRVTDEATEYINSCPPAAWEKNARQIALDNQASES